MRRHATPILLAIAVLLGTSGARAETLIEATWLQVAQGFPLTRTIVELGATGASTATSIAVDLSYPAFSTVFFVPKTTMGVLDLAITISEGGAQAITATPGMAGATQGIPGTVIVMTASHLVGGMARSMFNVGANTLVAVPLSNGKAGQFTTALNVLGAAHQITVDLYAWTPGTLSFMGLTSKGLPLPDVTATGSFNLGGNGFGTVTLIAPSKVSIIGILARRRTAASRS